MPTAAEKLVTARDQVLDRIIEVTASAGPDYTIDGQSVSKGTYLKQLAESLREYNLLIQQLGGPFEVRSEGVT